MKITQLEKARVIKVNELKLTQEELLSLNHFKCLVAKVSKLFHVANLANNERFFTILTFHFKYQILHA